MTAMTARQVSVRRLSDADVPLLEKMYDSFAPAEATLGLPPRDRERRTAWLAGLRQCGTNLVAVVDGAIVGHAALMKGGQAGEMAVFVHQDFRRQGVATALAEKLVEEAHALQLKSVWVLISSDNSPARTGLLKFGFHTAWESLGEVQMVYPL